MKTQRTINIDKVIREMEDLKYSDVIYTGVFSNNCKCYISLDKCIQIIKDNIVEKKKKEQYRNFITRIISMDTIDIDRNRKVIAQFGYYVKFELSQVLYMSKIFWEVVDTSVNYVNKSVDIYVKRIK